MKDQMRESYESIRERFSVQELRQKFINREDEELFRAVGESEMTETEIKSSEPHIAVWTGYEILTDFEPHGG
jgi:hypothetical protein